MTSSLPHRLTKLSLTQQNIQLKILSVVLLGLVLARTLADYMWVDQYCYLSCSYPAILYTDHGEFSVNVARKADEPSAFVPPFFLDDAVFSMMYLLSNIVGRWMSHYWHRQHDSFLYRLEAWSRTLLIQYLGLQALYQRDMSRRWGIVGLLPAGKFSSRKSH